MQIAIDMAIKGRNEGGIPIGSVLVENGKVIGKGHNQRVQKKDPMDMQKLTVLKMLDVSARIKILFCIQP